MHSSAGINRVATDQRWCKNITGEIKGAYLSVFWETPWYWCIPQSIYIDFSSIIQLILHELEDSPFCWLKSGFLLAANQLQEFTVVSCGGINVIKYGRVDFHSKSFRILEVLRVLLLCCLQSSEHNPSHEFLMINQTQINW